MNPPRWAAALVRFLVPPAAREHVLGDLHERLQATRPGDVTIAYLRDAVQTVPLVVWSVFRRSLNPTLVFSEGVVLYGAFVSGAFFAFGGSAPTFLTAGHGGWLSAVPALVSLIVLVIADVYTAHREPAPPFQGRLVASALAVAWLVNFGARYLVPYWSVPIRILEWGTIVSFGCVVGLRSIWAAGRSRGRFAVAGSSSGTDIQASARKLSTAMSRRTRGGSLVLLGLGATFGWFAVIAVNPLQRIGGILTAAWCLYGIYQLRHARPAPLPVTPDESAWLPVYRAELARQRDFHSGPSLWWRLLAMQPGYFLLLGGMAMAHPETAYRAAMIGAAFLLFGGLGIPMNRRLARRYQQKLDALGEVQTS